MIAFHLYWLWSLGANNVAVGCGPYGKLMALEAPIFPDMGLWKVQVLGMRKDLKLIYSIFERILSWPKRPKFNTLAEVKVALVNFVLKVRKDSSAQVRNGLLHLCNPEKFTNMYTYQEKVEYVLIGEEGPDHSKTFTVEARLNGDVIGSGKAHSKREAEQAAAKVALVLFGENF